MYQKKPEEHILLIAVVFLGFMVVIVGVEKICLKSVKSKHSILSGSHLANQPETLNAFFSASLP